MDEPDLGRVGIWSGRVARMSAKRSAEAARVVEELGFRTLWFPESVAKESLSLAGFLLAETESLIAATGIANIWARDAMAAINGARTLEEAYPGRFVLGLGVSHAPIVNLRGHHYHHPLEAMDHYLEAMESATYVAERPQTDPPVVLAALGPRMLKLAADRTAGAHPYFVPVDHTSQAREIMGDGALLAPEQAIVLANDEGEAREVARRHMDRYLQSTNYRNNLLRMGWPETDLEDGGSDALVDSIVAWGDVDAITARVLAHLEAGADHVCVQVLNGPGDVYPADELRVLAEPLLSL